MKREIQGIHHTVFRVSHYYSGLGIKLSVFTSTEVYIGLRLKVRVRVRVRFSSHYTNNLCHYSLSITITNQHLGQQSGLTRFAHSPLIY